MPVKDPGRIPVGLFQGEDLSDDAVRRLSVGASRIVAFAEGAAAETISDQWARVAPGLPVEVVRGVSDIREAIIEAAQRKVIWVCVPAPKNAARFVGGALQGAAAATEFEIPSVAVHVVRDEVPAGPVAWLTQTGEMSGYGVLYAAAMAAMSGRSVALIEPTELRAPRTPEAAEAAERYIEQAGIEVERSSDPAPLVKVLNGSFGAVVHPVLDAPGGRSLLHPGELPAKSVASGNAAAVVELIEKSPGDVVAVFDGVQLVYGGGVAARVAASVALGVVALTSVGGAAAPAAMAAPAPARTAHHQTTTKTGSSGSTRKDEGSGATGSIDISALSHAITVPAAAPAADAPQAGGQELVVRVTGPSTIEVANPTTVPLTARVHLTGQHGQGKTYDAGPRDFGTVAAGATTTLHLPEFAHDQGHHLFGDRLELVTPSGSVVGSIPLTQGQAQPGTEVHRTPPNDIMPILVTGHLGEPVTGQGTVQGQPGLGVKGESPGGVITPNAPDTISGQGTVQGQPGPGVKGESPGGVITPNAPDTISGQGTVQGQPGPGVKGESAVPIPTATATPMQVPGQVPTAIPDATPQMVPQVVAPQTGGTTGTTTPGTDTGTGTTMPGATTPGDPVNVTLTGTVTTVQTQQGGSTTRAATHQAGAMHHAAATHEGGQAATATSETGADQTGTHQLAHTGAGETGLLAGLAVVLMGAGAGLAAAARKKDDEEEDAANPAT
jgi:hypothetical protein